MKKQNRSFSDLLSILIKWKKFIIINMVLILVATAVISLLIDNKYKAKSVVMLPSENQLLSGGIGSILSDASSILGGGILGGDESIDKMLGILESRTVLEKVINKFDLIDYYDFSDYKRDKTLKALREDTSFDLNETGMIEITMIHKDSVKCAQIVNYFVSILDSLNKEFSTEQATNYRKFVEGRYNQNLLDLKVAEEQYEAFQEKYGVFVIPEQIELAIQSAGKLEAQQLEKEMEAEMIKQSLGANSPAYKGAEMQLDLLKKTISGLKKGDDFVDESIVFFPFKDAPKIQKEYFRLYREIEIQGKLLEYTLPVYEQALMEENKSMPTILVLDKAVPPQIKDSPKRSVIVLGVGMFFFFIFVVIILRIDAVYNKNEELNQYEQFERKFADRISKFYRMKTVTQ